MWYPGWNPGCLPSPRIFSWTSLGPCTFLLAVADVATFIVVGMQAERKLDGQWKLVYTSNSELFGLLALSRLPFVVVGDITQTVQASTLTVENRVRPSSLLHG